MVSRPCQGPDHNPPVVQDSSHLKWSKNDEQFKIDAESGGRWGSSMNPNLVESDTASGVLVNRRQGRWPIFQIFGTLFEARRRIGNSQAGNQMLTGDSGRFAGVGSG